MRAINKITAMLICTMFLMSSTSCLVVHGRHDNGKHKGWFKNGHKSGNSPAPGNGNGNSKHKRK
jgi:hypothetical protein